MTPLERLRGGLIVSIQPAKDSPMNDPHVIAAMALAAQHNGAAGLRIQGVAHLRAVRARTELPVIGLIKRDYAGFEPYITPTLDEVGEVAGTGAEIVAFDATARPRPGDLTVAALVEAVHAAGRLAMADCSTADEARQARAAGADLVAGTLCGHTPQSAGRRLPDLELVARLARLGAFAVCEGGVKRPEEVRAAFDAGADAVVVGTALTDLDLAVRAFAGSAQVRRNR